MRRGFATLDVFTNRRFAGNPLAVVLEAEGLSTDAMQAIAGEFNLSETVFVLPPEQAGHRARVRIFTPVAELPFAGHPTVGAAVLLARLDAAPEGTGIVLGENIGPVRCRIGAAHAGGGRAEFDLPRLPARVGDAAPPAVLAAALGLSVEDLGDETYAAGRWSAGVEYTLVPVRGLDAMARARPERSAWSAAFGDSGHRAAFVFCREVAEPGHTLHARMFAPAMGIGEDPATGSAVAALAGLVAQGLSDGEHRLAIEQGYEMGRASVLHLGLEMRGGALVAASIGGDAVFVSEGTIEA